MAARACLFLLVSLIGSRLGPEFTPELVVWNVGQGQWVTILDEQSCWHLDMGGEFAPWSQIMRACRGRLNRVSLSHWDSDHINFVGRARHQLPNLCVINRPLGLAAEHKMTLINSLPECVPSLHLRQWSYPEGKTPNAKSWVVLTHGVLAPGDSPRAQEKMWLHKLGDLSDVRILVLGHHGSRTSTSRELLFALSRVKMAISSARFQRYGHPHREVVEALERARIPMLRTEEWGTLHMFL